MYDKYLNKLESLLDTKLEKTEIVELSTYSDMFNLNNTIKKEIPNKMSDVNEGFSDLKNKIRVASSWTNGGLSNLEDSVDKFARSSKEIGFKPDDNKAYKDSLKTIKALKETQKILKKAQSAVKNFG